MSETTEYERNYVAYRRLKDNISKSYPSVSGINLFIP